MAVPGNNDTRTLFPGKGGHLLAPHLLVSPSPLESGSNFASLLPPSPPSKVKPTSHATMLERGKAMLFAFLPLSLPPPPLHLSLSPSLPPPLIPAGVRYTDQLLPMHTYMYIHCMYACTCTCTCMHLEVLLNGLLPSSSGAACSFHLLPGLH